MRSENAGLTGEQAFGQNQEIYLFLLHRSLDNKISALHIVLPIIDIAIFWGVLLPVREVESGTVESTHLKDSNFHCGQELQFSRRYELEK
jgi:hypothetical protein